MSKRIVWTMAQRPFVMGGDVNYPITTKVEVIEEKAVGKGFKAFAFKTAKGTLRIAESITGAIVGDNFKDVRKDISAGSKAVISRQIAEGKEILKSTSRKDLSNKKFFEIYKY